MKYEIIRDIRPIFSLWDGKAIGFECCRETLLIDGVEMPQEVLNEFKQRYAK